MTIESTAALATAIFQKMRHNLEVVRKRLARPLTLAEKILLGHLDDPDHQELAPGRSYVRVRPDRVVLQDVLGQSAMLQFLQTRHELIAVPTTIHCDHLIRARNGAESDLAESLAENHEVFDFLRSAAARFGAGFWQAGAGIIHQVVLENYAFPGELLIGTDSHTPNAGGLGACAVGVGGADAVEVMAGLAWELLYPKRIAVFLTSEISGWTAPKDVILFVAGQLTVSGATNAIIEYIGPGARTISATGKATITNMGAELGATTSIFPADERMSRYLIATGRGTLVPIIESNRDLLAPDPEAEAHPEKHYDRVLTIDLSKLEPHVVGPHTPDRARPISKFAAEISRDDSLRDKVSAALIGSCTNSSYEDMSRAADVARQANVHGRKAAVSLMVTPGSELIRATIDRDGQLDALQKIGATVLANACGPCIGQWQRPRVDEPNSIVTSYNRNFRGRNDGRASTMSFIASPEIVTAFALAGRLSFNPLTDWLVGADGKEFRLAPPKPAPEVPPHGFASESAHLIVPPSNGKTEEPLINPASERLQRIDPWPAWDGNDFIDLPILIKAKGKTTTDQISPAGAWLRYRGHLDKFSDNLLTGAVNAFSNEVGETRNVLSGDTGQPISKIARDYRARGIRWVIVGDFNYGEGSSREHAALSPRLLGGVAVIARSLARIHESNLKKQGLLPLTFADPSDYERIREDDRISIVGLSALAPGKPIEARLRHADGSIETLLLRHSFSENQLAWFRAGSALNALARRVD